MLHRSESTPRGTSCTIAATAAGNVSDVQRRLAALEAANRRLRRAVIALSLSLVVIAGVGMSAGQRVVEASGFVLRDAEGRARAQLAESNGVPSLSLYDEAGTVRLALAVDREGPIINLFSPSGQPRAVLAERESRSFLVLRDADGAPRAAIAVQESGQPSLYLLDEALNPIWRQPLER